MGSNNFTLTVIHCSPLFWARFKAFKDRFKRNDLGNANNYPCVGDMDIIAQVFAARNSITFELNISGLVARPRSCVTPGIVTCFDLCRREARMSMIRTRNFGLNSPLTKSVGIEEKDIFSSTSCKLNSFGIGLSDCLRKAFALSTIDCWTEGGSWSKNPLPSLHLAIFSLRFQSCPEEALLLQTL